MFNKGDKVLYSDDCSNFTATVIHHFETTDRVKVRIDPEYGEEVVTINDPSYLEPVSAI